MRGIRWEEVARVEFVTPTHPAIQSFLAWKARHIASQLEVTCHERRQEREELMRLFGAPIEQLLTEEDLLAQYQVRIYHPPTIEPLPVPTCRDCWHWALDRYHPGGAVCWEGWTAGPPRRLRTLDICGAFADRRPQPHPPSRWDILQEMKEWMHAHGLRYHGGRWKAHRNDLAHQAGRLGFDVGTAWEQAMRAWLARCYGPRFFRPERWLLIHTKAGALQYPEVDGVERVDDTHAFVYEIKHRVQRYRQLAEEYLPLLQRAYPGRVFTPIEINAAHPYQGDPLARQWPIHVIAGLEDRVMDGRYHLVILPAPLLDGEVCDGEEEPTAVDLVPHLRSLRCRTCSRALWTHEGDIERATCARLPVPGFRSHSRASPRRSRGCMKGLGSVRPAGPSTWACLNREERRPCLTPPAPMRKTPCGAPARRSSVAIVVRPPASSRAPRARSRPRSSCVGPTWSATNVPLRCLGWTPRPQRRWRDA